jgi:hypothetical protein
METSPTIILQLVRKEQYFSSMLTTPLERITPTPPLDRA